MIARLVRAFPNLAALGALVALAQTVDDLHRLQPEPPSVHMWLAIVFAVVTWALARGLVWLWTD